MVWIDRLLLGFSGQLTGESVGVLHTNQAIPVTSLEGRRSRRRTLRKGGKRSGPVASGDTPGD